MTIVVIVMAVMLGIVFGFAARQMHDLRENASKIEDLQAENETLRESPRVIKEQADVISNLIEENERLRVENAAHVFNLDMLLHRDMDRDEETA